MRDPNWNCEGYNLSYNGIMVFVFPYSVYAADQHVIRTFQNAQEFVDSLQEMSDPPPGKELTASANAVRRAVELKMAGFNASEIIEMTNAGVV